MYSLALFYVLEYTELDDIIQIQNNRTRKLNKKMEIDYKKILVLYIARIRSREGVTFVPEHYEDSKFINNNMTKPEFAALREAESEAIIFYN